MIERIKKLKVKKSDGTLSDYIPLGADAKYVDLDDGSTVQEAVTNINTSVEELQSIVINNSAAAHNGYYRGKDLTSYFNSGKMSTDLAAGDFSNIFPGDYIRKTKVIDGITYTDHIDIIAECDAYLGKSTGDGQRLDTHHVAIIPFDPLGTTKMNDTDSTVGGFTNSKMWTTTLPKYLTGYTNAYGDSHLLSFRSLLTKSIGTNQPNRFGFTSGGSSNFEYLQTKITLMSENQAYGGIVWSSAGFDTGEANTQLACFRLRPELIGFKNNGWWLRGIGTKEYFCSVSGFNMADCSNASSNKYVRPLLLLK